MPNYDDIEDTLPSEYEPDPLIPNGFAPEYHYNRIRDCNERAFDVDTLSVDPNAMLIEAMDELICERDQLILRIEELESTVLKLQGFVDAHYNRIRES
jgi:hypothetical protein